MKGDADEESLLCDLSSHGVMCRVQTVATSPLNHHSSPSGTFSFNAHLNATHTLLQFKQVGPRLFHRHLYRQINEFFYCIPGEKQTVISTCQDSPRLLCCMFSSCISTKDIFIDRSPCHIDGNIILNSNFC